MAVLRYIVPVMGKMRMGWRIFRALVEAGGDVDTPDSYGYTALHAASTHGFTEGVRYLVERGADVNKSYW